MFSAPVLLVGGTAVALASGLAGAAAILDLDLKSAMRRRKQVGFIERERDIAAALAVSWRAWLALRVGAAGLAFAVGLLTGVWSLVLILGAVAVFGLRFALTGRASSKRLRMERAFLVELRHLRDRMAVGNQSLDTALQEIGFNADRELRHVLAPLAQGGSVVESIVECGVRARSPIVEQACCVLIWARTRSLDALIDAIDDVLLPVGEAQLALQEEAMVTLAQQRAVTFAMAALMTFMFVTVIRVEAFRAFYESPTGVAVLLIAASIFAGLVGLLGRIVAVPRWSRWNLVRVAEAEALRHD